MNLIRDEWLHPCNMQRVITHWTCGTYRANDFEKEHYHFLVEGDGKVIRGSRSVADNVKTSDGVYAAHTLNTNSGSIGVSACCMLDCQERPFSAGPYPLTELQWQKMAEVVAELCTFYRILVTPTTVLGHGEVQANLGKRQRGKWDPMVLPWDPHRSPSEVGTYFRSLVLRYQEGDPDTPETPIMVTARVLGTSFPDALLTDGSSFLPIRAVARGMGWEIPRVGTDDLDLVVEGVKHTLAFKKIGPSGYVSARDLATALGLQPGWDANARVVSIG